MQDLLRNERKDPLSNLQEDGDKFSQSLDTFKDKVQSIVNGWMSHYCNAVGIKDPSLFSRPTSQSDSRSRGVSSRSRMVKSCMDYSTGRQRERCEDLGRELLHGS